MFYRFANPNQFMKLANAIQPWAARFTGVFFVFGTLKMILSERVRHDDQGTAMVRVLSFF